MANLAWAPDLIPGSGPIYLQIVDAIQQAIGIGSLREGDRLPPQRTLAQSLGVDLTTVTRAYDEARRRNLLDAVTGRGSFVAPRKDPTAPAIDLGMNIPPAPRGVRLAEVLARGVAELATRSNIDMLMTYHPGAGSSSDRAAAATWLRPVLGDVDPERILVAAGAQAAMFAIVSALSKPGDAIVCEPFVYPGMISIAQQLGLRIVTAAADADGMLPDEFEHVCKTERPKILSLNPTVGNPTTITMPEERRLAIVKVARSHGVTILEDDPYALLAGDAPPAFATIAPDIVWYVHTISKCLTPGLRVAYVVAPSISARADLLPALRAVSLMAPPLMTALLGGWIRDGVAASFLEGVREEAAARQDLARKALPANMRAHPRGLHVWLPLPAGWDRYRLADSARKQGLAVSPADAFRAGTQVEEAVRISLGAVPERARLGAALETLAGILREDQRAVHDLV